MEDDLITAREDVMDKVDLALESAWPHRKGDHFVDEMTKAVNKLKSIAEKMDLERISKTEIGRTYTNLGSVYSDLAPALGKEMLDNAKEAYQKAEKYLLGCNNELIIAKFNFNYANTLRQIDPNNIDLLSEAKKRYESAEAYFSVHAPQFLSMVNEGITSVNNLLLLAPIAKKIACKSSKLEKMNKSMDEKENAEKVMKEFQDLRKEDGGIPGFIGEMFGVLNSIEITPDNSKRIEDIRNTLTTIAGMAFGASKNTDPEIGNIYEALKIRLEKEANSEKIGDDRLNVLKELIHRIEDQTTGENQSLEEMLSTVQRQREIISNSIEIMHYPSYGLPRPPEGTKAAAMVERCWLLRRFIFEEMARTGKGPEESKQALELNIKSSSVDKTIYEAGADDKRAERIDFDMLRPFALEIRSFSSRIYPMLAKPIWSAVLETVDVKEVFYSGIPEMEKKFRLLAKYYGYIVQDQPLGHSYAESRWRQLLKSMTAIFDLRYAKETDLAAITYELGISLTIGKPIVIVINAKDSIPFDIEIKPVVMTGQAGDDELLLKAIDASLAWTYPRSSEKPFMATLDNVLSSFKRPLSNTYADQTFRMLQDQKKDCDPLSIDRMVNKLFEYLDDGKTIVIHPVFAPAYPEPDGKRVFHITPFRPDWAPKTRDQIKKTCKRLDVDYIRGDEADDPNVIRSIWKEIAIATHLVVDLTGFNANVSLELGIGHTLGKQLIMVGQKGTIDNLFPMISKLRIIPYDKPTDLDEIVSRFLRK